MSGERTLTPLIQNIQKIKMVVGAVGAARWLPNYDEFFFSLGNLLNTCKQQLNSTPSDRSEFHFRRLDELHKKHSCCCTRSRTINDARIAKTTRIDGSESSCYALAASDSRENSLPSTLIPNSCCLRLNVLSETPRVSAISFQRNPHTFCNV